MNFTDFKFKDYIQEALKEINFIEATEVQEKLIPIVLAGRDLVGEALVDDRLQLGDRGLGLLG